MTKTTFWNLIDSYTIEIPMIQRDYAQGRSGNPKIEQIRKDFVDALYTLVIDEKETKDLDFIYGAVEDNKLVLLDGQQRLTTLFLLHLYIAFKEDKQADVFLKLKKFTYFIRVSSREFCDAITTKENITHLGNGDSLSEKIKDSHWFYYAWKHDPTIDAMLTMLDSIEKKFTAYEYNDLWDKLTSINPPITFYFLEMDIYKMSDELYIKMNARGKGLTAFENFKAWLQEYTEINKMSCYNFWNNLDKDWSDFFWTRRNKQNSNIDDNIFYFFKNVLLSELVNNKEELPKDKEFSKSKLSEDIQQLIDDSEDFVATSVLEKCLNTDTLTKINDFLNWIENEENEKYINTFNNILNPSNILSKTLFYVIFTFIVKYPNIGDATFSYKLEQWFRVTENLIYNEIYNSYLDYAKAVKSLNKLSDKLVKFDFDIYALLTDVNTLESDIEFFTEQAQEEINKAKLINSNSDWLAIFSKYEKKNLYFLGQLDFLLKFSNNDITTFPKYAEIVHILFDEILPNDDILIQKALLCYGDYLIPNGRNRSFCQKKLGNARDRNENWRRVFNSDTAEGENSSLIFKKFIDDITGSTKQEIENVLKMIIQEKKPSDWRHLFYKDDRLITQCKNRNIQKINNNNECIILIDRENNTETSSTELRTRVLYLRYKKKYPKLISYKEGRDCNKAYLVINFADIKFYVKYLHGQYVVYQSDDIEDNSNEIEYLIIKDNNDIKQFIKLIKKELENNK